VPPVKRATGYVCAMGLLQTRGSEWPKLLLY
jgi:hypothetical protein